MLNFRGPHDFCVFFFFLSLMTFQFQKGSSRASLFSLSMAVPSRRKLCKQALGTANYQFILHLTKHLWLCLEQYAMGQFVKLQKHNAASFQKK